eukprot:6737719-Prymnesium_polylepis.2
MAAELEAAQAMLAERAERERVEKERERVAAAERERAECAERKAAVARLFALQGHRPGRHRRVAENGALPAGVQILDERIPSCDFGGRLEELEQLALSKEKGETIKAQ